MTAVSTVDAYSMINCRQRYHLSRRKAVISWDLVQLLFQRHIRSERERMSSFYYTLYRVSLPLQAFRLDVDYFALRIGYGYIIRKKVKFPS